MRVLHWFRKDIRLDDNTALSEAVHDAAGEVVPFYASEPAVLGRKDMAATRVRFVLDSLADLAAAIERAGSTLALDHGDAVETVVRAARTAEANCVYWNDEYEPSLRARDDAVARALRGAGIGVRRFHDRTLVPPDAVRTGAGTPYTVFTPYQRTCEALGVAAAHARVTRLAPHTLPSRPLATLERLGFHTTQQRWPGGETQAKRRLAAFVEHGLAGYATQRDLPGVPGTSRLAADLKFGTISPRTIVAAVTAAAGADPRLRDDAARYITEIRWRDFYAQVLFHFPHVVHGAFKREYDALRWLGDPRNEDAWREGRTGYPIVDAGMRELATTGFMHNRVRMIVASFLTKDLLLDWRAGERHFMQQLVDGDLASNNGGWQWAASTGTDAQPYFRIFNPTLQGERYDANGDYVRRWVPELARVPAKWIHAPWAAPPLELAAAGVTLGETYAAPIVDHATQRERAIEMYGAVAKGSEAGTSAC